MSQRVIVIHSPHSGRSSKLPDAIKQLEQAGLEVVKSISIADLDNLPAQGMSGKKVAWMWLSLPVAMDWWEA